MSNLLRQYQIECEINAQAMWDAEHYYKKLQRYMGLSGAVLGWVGVFLGTFEWANSSIPILILFLLASGTSSLLQTVSSFLNLSTRISAQHTSGAQYNDLIGDIKLFLAKNNQPEDIPIFVDKIHEVKDVYDSTRPFLPNKFWDSAKDRNRDPDT